MVALPTCIYLICFFFSIYLPCIHLWDGISGFSSFHVYLFSEVTKKSLRLILSFNMLQAPDKFAVAAVRNPVCNLALMVGTTDIPDWCFVEAYGSQGKNSFTEAPSAEQLTLLHSKSPVSHIHKVCWLKTIFSFITFGCCSKVSDKSILQRKCDCKLGSRAKL